MISQDLENTKGNIELIPDLPVRKFVYKGKKVISELSEGTSRDNSSKEQDMEYMHAQDLEHFIERQGVPLGEILVEEQVNKKMDILDEKLQAKEETKLMNLRKYLHH